MLDEKYFEKYLDDKFETIGETMNRIYTQALKTNDRVNHLEDNVDKLKDDIIKHGKECSAIPDVKTIKNDVDNIKENLVEYNYWKKHPKLGIAIIAGAVIALLGMAGFEFVDNFIKAKNAIKHKIETINFKAGPPMYDSLDVKPK